MALTDGFFVNSRGEHTFTPNQTSLFLRLPLAALGPNTEEAKFRLTSKEPKFDQTLTMKDDLIEGDEFAELLFEGVFSLGKFTLEVEPGGGKPKLVLFKDKSFLELAGQPPDKPQGKPPASEAKDGASEKEALKAAEKKEQYK